MPRRRRIKLPPRIALPAAELERKMMATLRGLKECAKLKGGGRRQRRPGAELVRPSLAVHLMATEATA